MFDKYRVNAHETIEDIARKFNTTKSNIEDLNNFSIFDTVREGMDIIVPKNKEKYFNTYTINIGDTLYQISKKYNINPELLAALNGLNIDDYIYPNQVIMIPVKGFSYYITKDGDTLETVSEMFKKNKEQVLKENDTIYLLSGQILVSKK